MNSTSERTVRGKKEAVTARANGGKQGASGVSVARLRNQRGNMFLESVFTLVPMFAMVFLIVDISFIVFVKGIFVHACREGVRWAITYSSTYNGQACGTQTACIKQVVQDNSLGFLRGSNSSYIVVNYYNPSNLTTPVTSATPPNYVNQTGNVVEVKIEGYPMNWMIPIPMFIPGQGMWLGGTNGLTLNSEGADVLQGYPIGMTAPPPA